jgi:hypothetical protein
MDTNNQEVYEEQSAAPRRKKKRKRVDHFSDHPHSCCRRRHWILFYATPETNFRNRRFSGKHARHEL